MALVKKGLIMSRSFPLAVIIVAVIGVMIVLARRESRTPLGEKVIEFTYSRTQPCNSKYYNYVFSVGPLMDLMQSWRREQGSSRFDFRGNLKAWIRSHSKNKDISLTDEEIDALCRKVEIVKSPKNKFGHPILCMIKIPNGNSDVVELLACAYRECMLANVERENIMSAEKATMREIGVFQRQEREVQKLKNMLSSLGLSDSEAEQLRRRIVDAERIAIDLKAEWQAAKKAYRGEWDASIVFLE